MDPNEAVWERFRQSAALAFEDGRRVMVPVLGAGSRRWLTADTGDENPLVSWKGLVGGIAHREGVSPTMGHDTLTAAFEDVVHAVHARSPETQRVSQTERRLILEHVVGPMRAATAAARAADDVRGRAARLQDATFADRIDLCFDSVLADARSEVHAGSTQQVDPHTTCVVSGAHRVWHPHGYTERDGREPYVVLGVQRYGRALSGTVRAFERHMRRGRGVSPAEAHALSTIEGLNAWRAAAGPALVPRHWLEVALDAPLVLLGVGLGHEEWDLRWFLQARARVHARMPAVAQPWTFRLTCGEESEEARTQAHAATPGIELLDLYVDGSWDEAWERFFDTINAVAPSRRAVENT
jgi:hypothetical protein